MYVSVIEYTAAEKSAPSKNEGKSKSPDVSVTKKLLANTRTLPKFKQIIKELAMDNIPGMLKRYRIWSMQKQIAEIERLRLKGRKPMDSVPDIYLDSFRDELIRLVELIRSQGIEVMLTSYPTLMSHDNITKYPEIYLDGRRFHIYLSLKGMVSSNEKMNAVIEQIAIAQKTLYFDASSVIPKTTDYFGDLFHLTDKGAQRFAEGVSSKILSKQYIIRASVH